MILTTMRSRLLSVTLFLFGCLITSEGAKESKKVFRKKNLDYLNSETLQFYVDDGHRTGADYDVAVLFYANWDRHSHSFAPLWGQIAHLLKAGTQDSKLIMGLFDCEVDLDTADVCSRAGITHYPTVMFFSLSGQSLQGKRPKHATKFGGNWQYGDAVLDWLKTMRGLSQWHRAGWGKRLRSLFVSSNDKKPELPVGLPSSSSSSSSSSSMDDSQLKKLKDEKTEMHELAIRGSVMVESLLFPTTTTNAQYASSTLMSSDGKNFTDAFRFLNASDGWTSTATGALILRTCVQDVSLDYCQRYTTLITEELFAEAPASSTNWTKMSILLEERLQRQEPYCLLIENCVLSDFKAAPCRPASCPYQDPVACRYLTSCFYDSMQADYAKALGIDFNATKMSKAAPESNKEETKTTTQEKKGGGFWGLG